jgi:hypothetical protein
MAAENLADILAYEIKGLSRPNYLVKMDKTDKKGKNRVDE